MFRSVHLVGSWFALAALQLSVSAGWGQITTQAASRPATNPSAWRTVAPASDAQVYAALDRPIAEITYDRAALADVVRDLRERLGINIHVQVEHLAELDIPMSRPASLTLRHVPAKRVLRLVLEDLSPKGDLAYEVLDGVLEISTRVALNRELVLRTYDVRDLATRDPVPGDRDAREEALNRIEQLAKLVTDCIDPDSWAVNGGGEASIAPFRGILTVCNTPHVQEQAAGLLDAIRTTPTGQSSAVPPISEEQRRLDEPIRAALETVLPTVEYDGVPLARVVDDLRRRFRINVHVFTHELKAAGIEEDAPVRLHLHNVTVRRMLTQAFNDWVGGGRIGFEIDAGVLVIGTPRDASCLGLTISVHNVGDIAPTEGRRQILAKMCTDMIDPDSWAVNGGGCGNVCCYGPLLVIAQRAQAQTQIDAFLHNMRQRLAAEPATTQP